MGCTGRKVNFVAPDAGGFRGEDFAGDEESPDAAGAGAGVEVDADVDVDADVGVDVAVTAGERRSIGKKRHSRDEEQVQFGGG